VQKKEEGFWKRRIKVINNGAFAPRADGIIFARNTVSAELNEDQPNESEQPIYSKLATARAPATITSILAKTQRQAEWENFTVGKRNGWLQVCLDWGYCQGEAGDH
jgi:hypothetical protein